MASSNPAWAPDELILALDLYFREPRAAIDKPHPELAALSDLLQSLPIHPPETRAGNFRTPGSCYMKLQNFKALDPGYDGRGLSAGSAGDREVFERYYYRRDELARLAALIRTSTATREPATLEPAEGEESEGFAEGRIVYRLHRSYERNPSAARACKDRMTKAHGELFCEVCKITEGQVTERFGLPSGDLFEVHHQIPLHQLGTSRTTKATDLAVLCPTCHRAIHRLAPLPTVETLAKKFPPASA